MKLNLIETLGGAWSLVFLAGLFPSTAPAQDQNYAEGWLGGSYSVLRATNYTGTASVSANVIDATYYVSADFGRIDERAYSFYIPPPASSRYGGYAFCQCTSGQTVTIQPDNPALLGTPGTATFTYYLNGNSADVGSWSGAINGANFGPYYSTPSNGKLTYPQPFTFGSPFQMDMELDVTADSVIHQDVFVIESLTQGGFTVTNNSGNSTAYHAVSDMGSGRSVVLTNGDAYAGFTLTNTVGNQTAAALLAGTATASNETLVAQFTASHGTNGIVSDVVDFSGTGTNLFALQMSYNPLAALAQLGGELNTALQYLDPATQLWTNAIFGNSDGGTNNRFLAAAFDLGKFALGNWGVDTNAHSVWAVLDHNSRFAVGGAFTPVLRCAGITLQTNGVSVSLVGPASGQYFIDQSTNVSGTNWTQLGHAVPDQNGAATFFDSTLASTNQQRFYRARQ